MQKIPAAIALLSLVSTLGLSALIPPVSSDFSTADYWSSTDLYVSGDGSTSFASNHLNYLVDTPTPDDSAGRAWLARQGLFVNEWTVSVDVHLGSAGLSTDQYANLNLVVVNGSDNMSLAIDRYFDGSAIVYNFECFLNNHPVGTRFVTASNVTDGTLSLSHLTSFNGTLLASFSSPDYNSGIPQTLHYFDNLGSTWAEATTSPYLFSLVGGSGHYSTFPGPTLAMGDAYFSNFQTFGLTSIPEPSTFTALAGLFALLLAARLRFRAR